MSHHDRRNSPDGGIVGAGDHRLFVCAQRHAVHVAAVLAATSGGLACSGLEVPYPGGTGGGGAVVVSEPLAAVRDECLEYTHN